MSKAHMIASILLGVTIWVFAATSPVVVHAQDELQLASEAIRNQKRIYIEKAMEFTANEKDLFWRLYAEYETGLAKIQGMRIKLATNFLTKHGDLSDAEALDMLEEKMRIDGDELKFKKSYVNKYKQILPGRKVTRFYQIENRFDSAATSELYRNIPVIR